jgi:predicted DNA-binding transcriptional regulator AlpA
MSLVTQAFVFEHYGPRLDMDQLAEVLRISKSHLYNQVSAGTLPVKTYLVGSKRFADYVHVAEHLDACRQQAA